VTAPNFTEFRWSAVRIKAAVLVAEDRLTDAEIAAEVGISKRQLENWKAHPEFAARVDAQVAAADAAISRKGIARQMRRVQAQDDRWRRMQAVIEARAGDGELAAAPGGDTGLLVRQQKALGGGDNFQVVDEFAVDTGLLRELRELEKQAAQELGQWTDRHEYSGGVIHVHAAAAELAKRADLADHYRAAIGPPAADR
jgi:hypothetical protein